MTILSHDKINSTLKIKHFIAKQIVDTSTALSSKQCLCIHLSFKKILIKILSVFRPLNVSVFACLLIKLKCMSTALKVKPDLSGSCVRGSQV